MTMLCKILIFLYLESTFFATKVLNHYFNTMIDVSLSVKPIHILIIKSVREILLLPIL